MTVIRVPAVLRPAHQTKFTQPVVLVNGYLEYVVSDQMAELWNSLSERERENALNICYKQNRDLRDVLSDLM